MVTMVVATMCFSFLVTLLNFLSRCVVWPQREDYDAAKALKVDIDKLRRAADADGVAKPGGARRSNNPQDIFDRVLDVAGPPEGMMAESHPMMASSGAPRHSEGGEEPPGASVGGSPVGGSARGSYGFNPEELPGPDGVPPQGGSRVLHSRDESYGGSFVSASCAFPNCQEYSEELNMKGLTPGITTLTPGITHLLEWSTSVVG